MSFYILNPIPFQPNYTLIFMLVYLIYILFSLVFWIFIISGLNNIQKELVELRKVFLNPESYRKRKEKEQRE